MDAGHALIGSPMRRGVAAVGAVLVTALLCIACSGGESSRSASTTLPDLRSARPLAVGTTKRTFVDSSRPTQANGTAPALASRTLVTTVVYPATSTGIDAPADRAHGPYPLIVLAHGFGGDDTLLLPLATEWARAGYVVAVPLFPLTNARAVGGVNGADIANQPGDVSFLIDTLTHTNDALADGVIDTERIGLAGHSNGGITTLGTIANSCCRDRRIDAAIVFAGITSPFGGGTYDVTDLPPVMFVHGVNDAQIDYDQAARIFNSASSPKAMLRVDVGDHVSIIWSKAPTWSTVVTATTDFLDLTLRGDTTAADRLATDQVAGQTTMFWSPDADHPATVPVSAQATMNRTATISRQDGVRNGDRATVTWSGFLPGKTVNIVQCTGDGRGGSETCEIVPGRVLIPDPTGSGSLDITFTVGKVGNGVCDAAHPCTILVNDAGLQDEDAFVRFPITFAP